MTAIAFSSCEMSDQDTKNPNINQQGEVFSFETQHRVDLQADLGPMSINGLVQVFTNDPTQYVTENGKIVDSYTEGDAVYNTYANQDGRATGSFELPDYVDKVWVSVHAIGVGGTVECPVENGQIHLDLGSKQNVKRAKAPRATADVQVFSLPSERMSTPAGWTNFQTLVKWWDGSNVEKYGKVISDPNGLISWDGAAYTDRTPIDYSDLHVLLKALWKGSDSKPSGLNNSNLCVKDVSLVNTTIHVKGDKTGTKLWFRFMDEHAWNQNVIGYYYYPEGQEASLNKKTMKKYIILPNASKPNHYPYCKPTSNAPYETEYAPAQSGMAIQMLFEDPETGIVSEVFPAGYTIGFFCLSDSYNANSSSINVTDGKALFSNDALNSDGRSRFICLSMTSNDKDYLVYGLEDGTSDKSYEDILFIIDAEEPDMIQEPERVTIESVTGTTTNNTLAEHVYYTYAFEDNYEDKRDYDLNDVVIEHHRVYNSKKTSALQKQLTNIVDYFSLTSTSAAFDNAFGLQYAKSHSELGQNISIKYEASKNGADWTTWTPKTKYQWTNSANKDLRTYILYNSKNLDGVKYFRVTRTFNGVIDADEVREAEQSIYPFIIPKWDTRNGNSWNEIHLPGNEITPYAINAENNEDDFHFVDTQVEAGMLFPYAIRLTLTKTDCFEPSTEGRRIDKTYPKYTEWIHSKGSNAQDWYKK